MSEGCATCSGRCCYDIYVRITGFDAARIAAAQRLDVRAFCRMPETDDASGCAFLLADGQLHDLALAQQHDETGACIWLMHVGSEVKRCGIYASRPHVCAVYPFVISQGTIDIRADARCQPGDWKLSALDMRRRRYDFSAFAAESELYRAMVGVWNDATGADRSEAAYDRFVIAAAEAFFAGAGAFDDIAGRWTEALLPAALAAKKERLLLLASDAARAALGA
jgi:Fe-S-cluster containining protein